MQKGTTKTEDNLIAWHSFDLSFNAHLSSGQAGRVISVALLDDEILFLKLCLSLKPFPVLIFWVFLVNVRWLSKILVIYAKT